MKITNVLVMLAAFMSAMLIGGCDRSLTPEKMTTISTAVGKTAGYACELTKTSTEVKTAVMNVLDIVAKVAPSGSETFTEAWTPVIDEEVKKLVDAGKVGATEAQIIKTALAAATEGLDYVFIKHPKAKDAKELVSAAVDGFIAGYKSVVALASGEYVEVDDEAYKYIKGKLDAMKK